MMFRSPLLACVSLSVAGALGGAEIRLAGSDLARAALEPAVAEFNRASPVPVLLALEGSRGGLADLRAGRAALAILAAGPADGAPGAEHAAVPLAYQVAVFAVADTNPLRQASLPQLASLFGDREATKLRQWGGLVPDRNWAEKAVVLHAVANPRSLAVDLFRATALREPKFKAEVTFHSTTAEAAGRVRIDEASIALLSVPPAGGGGVHLVQVSRRNDEVAFGPTPENIHAGDYPARLPFHVVFRRDRAAELLPVLRLLLGDAVASGLAASEFVPVPANARRQLLRDLGDR